MGKVLRPVRQIRAQALYELRGLRVVPRQQRLRHAHDQLGLRRAEKQLQVPPDPRPQPPELGGLAPVQLRRHLAEPRQVVRADVLDPQPALIDLPPEDDPALAVAIRRVR